MTQRKWRALLGAIILVLFTLPTLARILAQGGDLRYGQTVEGQIDDDKPDAWLFAGTAGDVIALTAERASGELQPMLMLLDPAGQPVAGTQGQTAAVLVQVRLPQTGPYTVQVSGAEQARGGYRLTLALTQGAPTPTPQPVAPEQEQAGALSFDQPVQGEIGGAVYRQIWRFSASSGAVVDIRMTPLSGDLDPFLSLVAPTNDVLATNESANGGLDAGILAFQLPYSGDYLLIARRSGENNGRAGKTNGRYELSVRLRGPETAAQNSLLALGSVIQGRLNESFPRAVYRLEVGGALALHLDLNGANRLARLRVLDTSGRVLQELSGLGPLSAPLSLPREQALLLEVSTTGYDNLKAVDFSVGAFRLLSNPASSNPLRYAVPRQSTLDRAETWFFIGQKGDLITLDVRPDRAALDTVVRITGPGAAALSQGVLGTGLRQPLTLPQSGLYEITVRSPENVTDGDTAYSLNLQRTGANGISFDGFTIPVDLGPMPLNAPVAAALNGGGNDARWLDATAGQVIDLAAAPLTATDVIGLALQRPDGALVDVQVSRGEQPAVLQRTLIEQTGRYRVLVFDAAQSPPARQIRYTLRYGDASGGSLQTGQRVKGIVSPANGLAVWSLDVPAGALINAQLVNLVPLAWQPSLLIADPAGQIIAATAASTPAAPGERPRAALLGVAAPLSGRYSLLAAGMVTGSYAAFELVSDVQIPFQADTTQRVNVSATRPPVERYTVVSPGGPVQVSIAELVNPVISPAKVPPEQIQAISFGATVRGEIARGALAQVWRFSIGSNLVVQARATSLSGGEGPDLTLWDRKGNLIFEQFHADGPTTVLTYRVITGSTYDLVVSAGLNGGRYTLSLTTLPVTTGALQLSAGTPMLYGQTVPGELLSAEETDAYYFLGLSGDVIDLSLKRITGTLQPALLLLNPRGEPLGENQTAGETSLAALNGLRLPDSGMYTVLARNSSRLGRASGRYALSLGLASELRQRNRGGGIIAPGESRAGLLTFDDGEDLWLFRGQQGQRVSLTLTGEPSPAPLGLQLLDTAGRAFAVQTQFLTENVVTLSDVLLPAEGVYQIRVVGGSESAGVYSLYFEPDADRVSAGPLRIGQTVTGIFAPQRNASTWVFSATAGDVVSIALRYVRGDPFIGSFQLRAENGVPLATVADLNGLGARADVLLPFDGSYTVVAANPDGEYKGAGVYALSVNLQDSRARSAGGVLRYGEQGSGDIYADDPLDTWVFGARAGDRVRIRVQSRDRFLRPALELRTPTGDLLASALPDPLTEPAQAGIGDSDQSEFVIPFDSAYSIRVTGADGSTGSYLLSLEFTPPPIAEVERIAYGETRNGLIAADRPAEFYTFAGQQGDTVTATMTRESGATLSPVLELRAEDGTTLARADSNDGDSAVLRDFRLPATGTYKLVATRFGGANGQTDGRYTVKLEGSAEARPVRGSLRYGQQAIGRLNDQNPVDRLTFEGRAGDVIGIVTRATSGDLDIDLSLETATGAILAANDDANGTDAALTIALPADGTYTVVLSRVGTRTAGSAGNYDMTVNLLYQGQAAGDATSTTLTPSALNYGARVVGAVDAVNSEARYLFRGNRGDEVGIQLLHQTDDAPPLLTIQDPAGTVLAEGTLGIGRTAIERYRLPADGLYTIRIRRPSNARLNYSPYALTIDLQAASTSPSASGGVLDGALEGMVGISGAVTGTFQPGETAHYWLFMGKVGQSASLELLWLNGDLLPSALLIGPNGQALRTVRLEARAANLVSQQIALPADGLYTVLVLPGGMNRSGQYRLIVERQAALIPQGQSIAPGFVLGGQIDPTQPDQRYSFNAEAGQTVSARLLVTSGGLEPRLLLLNAEGRTVAEGAPERTDQGRSSAIESSPIPAAGTYFLAVSGQGAGTYRLLLEIGTPATALTPQAVAARLVAYNQPLRGVIKGGESVLWAFVGAAGDVINITALANNPGDGSAAPGIAQDLPAPSIELQDVGGRVLRRIEAAAALPEAAETDLTDMVLPAAGRYLVVLRATLTSSYTLLIQRRQDLLPADMSGIETRPLVPDIALQNGISPTDIIDYWTFEGKAGSVISLVGARLNGNLRLDMSLFGPSGYVGSGTATFNGAEARFGPIYLPDDGRYLLVTTRWLGSSGRTVGGYRLTMSNSTASGSQGGQIPIYGRTVAGAILAEDATDDWAFDAQAGDVIDVRMARLGGNLRPAFEVISPDGRTVIGSAQAEPNAVEASAARLSLPGAGRYTVRAGRMADTTGTYRLLVNRAQTAAQASIAGAAGIGYDQSRQGELTPEAATLAWVLYGKAGDQIVIDAAPTVESALDPYLTLLSPDGQALAADDNNGGGLSARIAGVVLPGDGFYGIVVSGSALRGETGRYGAFTLSVQRGQPGATYQGQIQVGDEVSGELTLDQPVHAWNFEIEAGQFGGTIAASLSTDAAAFNGVLLIVDANGGTVAVSQPAQGGDIALEAALPGPGRYTVLVAANAPGAQGAYRLRLNYALAPTGGGLLLRERRAYGVVSNADFSDSWRFTLDAPQKVVISAARLSGDLELDMSLFGPDGKLILNQQAEGSRTLTLPPQDLAPGTYTIIVSRRGGPAGQSIGSYTLLAAGQ